MGEDGARRVVVNSVGREIRTLDEVPPVEGRRVQLTHQLRDAEGGRRRASAHFGYCGSAVVLDPRTGDVLTLVSLPALRSERLRDRHRSRDVGSRSTPTSCGRCRIARSRAATQPGSTFKIVVATAALEEGLITPEHASLSARAAATFYGRFFKCHLAGGHG